MPNVNDKIMIELVLNAKKAIQEAQKAVNAISGIKDKQQKKDKETAEKQSKLAENATKKATAFEKKFSSSVSRDLNLLFRRFFGIYAILKAAQSVDHFARMGAEVRDLAKSAGMAEQKFEKLGYAAKKAGGSYASTAQTVKSLTLGLQNMKFGSGGAIEQAAMRYGLETGRDGQIYNADELLKSIARTMGSLKGDNAAQIDLANILGLDEATFDMVRGGEASYLKELARAKATDKKDKDLYEQYKDKLNKLGAEVDYLGMKGGSVLLPPVLKILDVLLDILNVMPNAMKGAKNALEENGVPGDSASYNNALNAMFERIEKEDANLPPEKRRKFDTGIFATEAAKNIFSQLFSLKMFGAGADPKALTAEFVMNFYGPTEPEKVKDGVAETFKKLNQATAADTAMYYKISGML